MDHNLTSDSGALTQDSFPVNKILHRLHKSDTTTIRTIALSSDGAYLALGFDSGLIELRTTAGAMMVVRLFTTGAQVNSIIWHPLVRDCFIAGSTNGIIHTVIIKPNQRNDIQKVYKVKDYIVTMALNHDASLLAVAFGRKIALLSNWFSDSRGDTQISYLSTRGLMPKSSLGVPQNLYFLDEYTLVVFFLHRVISFSTVHPFAPGWGLPAVDRAWFGKIALSPTKDQFVAANMIDGLDLYSIPGKRWLRTHEFRTTAHGPSKSRLHSVSYLNARTVVSGHTQSFIVVVRDTHRAGPEKFQQFFVRLNAEIDRVTHTVITGRIKGKPVILAINGEGRRSVVYILDVLFAHPPAEGLGGNLVVSVANIFSVVIAILVLGVYYQVHEASKACRNVDAAAANV